MGMPSSAPVWTREMVWALPDDGNRYELFDGELLVTPAPRARHQDLLLALVRRLDPYVRNDRLGHLGVSPADLALEGGQVAQPDIYVVPMFEGRPPRNCRCTSISGMPERNAKEIRRPMASASAIAEPPAFPNVTKTSNGCPRSSS